MYIPTAGPQDCSDKHTHTHDDECIIIIIIVKY